MKSAAKLQVHLNLKDFICSENVLLHKKEAYLSDFIKINYIYLQDIVKLLSN